MSALAASASSGDQFPEKMREYYLDLVEFSQSEPFKSLVMEMYGLPPNARPEYVRDFFLDPKKLEKLGVDVPDGILIQRSSFGDRRPTLFCIKKFLPEHDVYPWQNVNITFDNFFSDLEVPRGADGWRTPLHYDAQARLIETGVCQTEVNKLEPVSGRDLI